MLLKENVVCPYHTKCPHNSQGTCQGSYKNRSVEFSCDLVDNIGNFINMDEHYQRHPLDETGRMRVIME